MFVLEEKKNLTKKQLLFFLVETFSFYVFAFIGIITVINIFFGTISGKNIFKLLEQW